MNLCQGDATIGISKTFSTLLTIVESTITPRKNIFIQIQHPKKTPPPKSASRNIRIRSADKIAEAKTREKEIVAA